MKEKFEICSGTVIGKDHLRPLAERNNQDASAYLVKEDLIVAVVCDGCGSERSSEVGARIGSRLIVELFEAAWSSLLQENNVALEESFLGGFSYLLSRVEEGFFKKLRQFSEGPNQSETIKEEFLFTVLGLIITPSWTAVFSAGDGVFAVNGQVTVLDSGPKNEPDYPAYALFKEVGGAEAVGPFKVRAIQKTQDLKSVLIGTDGLIDLVEAENKTLPGKSEFVGPLSQFWVEDHFFQNPDQVRRRLALINREVVREDFENGRLVRESGHLRDDTTLIVVRRIPEEISGSTT